MHIDLLRVRLDQAISATVVLELVGAEDAPGVKEGGVLEQVTRELNIEALPGDIPDSIQHDVSGLADRRHGHARVARAPRAASRSSTIPRPCSPRSRRPGSRSRPRRRSRRRPSCRRGRDGRRRARRPPPKSRRRRERGRGRGRVARPACPGVRARRLADRRPRQPGRRVRRHPPQHRLRGRRRCSPSAGSCRKPKAKYRGLLTEGRTGPGGPRVAILLPQTYMNDAGRSVGPARGALKVDARPRARHPRRDRPAVRRDPHPHWAAGWPATTG